MSCIENLWMMLSKSLHCTSFKWLYGLHAMELGFLHKHSSLNLQHSGTSFSTVWTFRRLRKPNADILNHYTLHRMSLILATFQSYLSTGQANWGSSVSVLEPSRSGGISTVLFVYTKPGASIQHKQLAR